MLGVEDDQQTLDMLHEVLTEDGLKTTALERGSPALALLEERHFVVLLVDIYLPDINGLVIGEKMCKRYGERADIQVLGDRRGRQHR